MHSVICVLVPFNTPLVNIYSTGKGIKRRESKLATHEYSTSVSLPRQTNFSKTVRNFQVLLDENAAIL